MKKILGTLLLILSVNFSYGQVGFSYLHSDVVSAFGISTNPEKRVWAEARLTLDVGWSDVGPELVTFVNVIKREDFDFFVGAGGRFNALEGVILPAFGFQVRPIASKPNLAIHTEGMFIAGPDVFKGSVGLRYFLRKKEKKNKPGG